jgi:hypothetical protein
MNWAHGRAVNWAHGRAVGRSCTRVPTQCGGVDNKGDQEMETAIRISKDVMIAIISESLGSYNDFTKGEKEAVGKIVTWLVDMCTAIYDEAVPDYEQGAPSSLFCKLEEEGLDNSTIKIFHFFANMAKTFVGDQQLSVCSSLIFAFIFTSLFERNWHAAFCL